MAGPGDCRLLIALMGVVVFLVAARIGVNGADFSTDCTNPILSLSPCLEFVTGFENVAAQPTKDCCSVLANVLAHEPGCLCLFFWSSDLLGFPIDRDTARVMSMDTKYADGHSQICVDYCCS
jgi:hypothetical protein